MAARVALPCCPAARAIPRALVPGGFKPLLQCVVNAGPAPSV